MTSSDSSDTEGRALSNTYYIDNLVKTLDKREVLLTLRQWRYEAKNNFEADVIADFIKEVESGRLDG